MLGTLLQIAFLLFSLAILMNFWRLVKGPDLPDRILALDTISFIARALSKYSNLFRSRTADSDVWLCWHYSRR